MQSLKQIIDETSRQGWPSWGATRGPSIKAGNFEVLSELFEQLEESFVHLIYGSNHIENVGSSYEITLNICRNVFRGLEVKEISERDPEYAAHIQSLREANRQTNQAEVGRSRLEIVQHAQALNFVIEKIVLQNEPWSENLILQAHKILYQGLEVTRDDVEPGAYRQDACAALYVDAKDPKKKPRKTIFLRAECVMQYMADMISDLNDDIKLAEASESMDPYSLAAKYHHRFVNIHPFGDGNGRMSRIILNTLLLKYAGHVSPFGEDETEKNAYIRIAHYGSRAFHDEDMEVPQEQQKGHFPLARFILINSKSALETLRLLGYRNSRVEG
ncbi:fido domain-containing protein [Xylariaceae sp. FL0804]|nr:fido domain-containing protein [Xylariaceae sp. FL0804]